MRIVKVAVTMFIFQLVANSLYKEELKRRKEIEEYKKTKDTE